MIDLAAITADKGNLNVVSDAGVAVLSAYAGLKSAALNVYVNAKGSKTGTSRRSAWMNSKASSPKPDR